MEMHMVHVNSKHVRSDGTLDASYSSEALGVAVLGFVFQVNGEVNKSLSTRIYSKFISILESMETRPNYLPLYL